jgi:diguanylate cyclase (GGDEF)-like protein
MSLPETESPATEEYPEQIAKLTNALALSVQEGEALKARVQELEASNEALQHENDGLYDKAYTDKLTGVARRESLDEKLPELIEIAKNNQEPLACLIVDSDGLKRVNEKHSYRDGDRLIQAVSSALSEFGVGVDLVAKLGGDEFCLAMPGFKPKPGHSHEELVEETIQVINRVIDEKVSELGLSEEVHAGASVGFSELDLSNKDDNFSELLARADNALKEDKAARKARLESQGVVFDKEDDRKIKSTG